jgi:hypothetical protein
MEFLAFISSVDATTQTAVLKNHSICHAAEETIPQLTKDPSKNPSKPGRAEIAKALQTISVTFLQPKQRPLQDSLLIYDPFHTAP